MLSFSAVDGLLRGHADGIIIAGPTLSGVYLNFPLLWEHKAVNAEDWRALERDGLEKAFPQYAAQVALYQAYLDVTNPALFTASSTPIPASGCTSSCRSTPSVHRRGAIAPSPSSRQRAPASCCRAAY